MAENFDPSTPSVSPGTDPGQVPASPPVSTEPQAVGSLNQPQAPAVDVDALKRGMYQAQQEAATLKKRLRDVEPFVDEFQKNPSFRDYMYERAREFGQDSTTGQAVDPGVLRVLEPALQDARAARYEVAQWKYDQQMNALAEKFPDVMTADAKRELSIEAEASGVYDLEYHFLKKYGMSMVEKARQQGQKEAVQVIQANNKLYANSPPTTAIAPPIDLSQASEEEKQKFINSEIGRIMNEPDYAAKVAREVG